MTKSGMALAQRYARWHASAFGRLTQRLESRIVLDMAGDMAGKRVLDIGTGDGTYALEAAQHNADVTGFDRDPEVLTEAAKRAQDCRMPISFQQGRVEALPFRDASFDIVLAVTVFCFASDTETAAREMARVLVPGGRLMLGELNRFSAWAAERRMRGWFGSKSWIHAHFRTRRDLTSLITKAGLRVAGILAPIDPLLSRIHAPGAAFLAIAADKHKEPR